MEQIVSGQQQLRVADSHRVERTLAALAAKIAAAVSDELMLLGIRRRGVPLAEKLSERLQKDHSRSSVVSEVTVKN